MLRAELARLFARRFTRIMLLALVLSLAIVGAVAASESHRPSPAELRQAEQEAAEQRAACRRAAEEAPPGVLRDCDQITREQFLPYVMGFTDDMPELLMVYAGLLALLGYLVGASFLGVEWSSGGVANLLLWRTRRLRVLFGKLTALVLGMVAVGVVVGAAWVASVWAIARLVGVTGDPGTGFWTSLGLDGLRTVTLAVLAAMVGAAIAALGRRTAAALGLLIGYLVVWEIGARTVMFQLGVSDVFMLSAYVDAFLFKEHRVWRPRRDCFESFDCAYMIGWPWGLAVLVGVAVLATAVAAISFRRRDVT